jgi:hypothetical protein
MRCSVGGCEDAGIGRCPETRNRGVRGHAPSGDPLPPPRAADRHRKRFSHTLVLGHELLSRYLSSWILLRSFTDTLHQHLSPFPSPTASCQHDLVWAVAGSEVAKARAVQCPPAHSVHLLPTGLFPAMSRKCEAHAPTLTFLSRTFPTCLLLYLGGRRYLLLRIHLFCSQLEEPRPLRECVQDVSKKP